MSLWQLHTPAGPVDITEVMDKLLQLYTEDQAFEWLFSDNKLLDGKKGIDLIKAGDIDKVRQVLDGVLDGTYL